VSETATATTVIEVRDLRIEIALRHSTIHAVDGVSFDIEKGEKIGLVGESGCGKTTTGLGLLRLLPPGGRVVGGTVRLGGQELTGLRESELQRIRGRGVGVVFQDPMTSLNPTQRVGRQLAEVVRHHQGADRPRAWARAVDRLRAVRIPAPERRARQLPHE
jgi:ABC-type dipeptide/oligopeptide/nickel transport system ATPase component